MAIVVGSQTYEDLCRAREDGQRYELLEGRLAVVAAPSPKRQRVSRRLVRRFDDVLTASDLGEVFNSPLDVRLAPDTVVQPDLFVVLTERSHIVGELLIEGAPDLIVEILSRSSRGRDLSEKARLCERFGVREYWTVDLVRRAITVNVLKGGHYEVVPQEVGIARSVILPELTVDVAALFAELP